MFRAKVRGIYSTALTRLLLDNGFKIVQPSAPIRERFKLPEASGEEQPNLEISDRFDRQGVNVMGEGTAVEKFASILFNTLNDVITRRKISTYASMQMSVRENNQLGLMGIVGEPLRGREFSASRRRIRIDVEFPSLSKRKLDEIRSIVVPTLSGHHYYRACGGKIAYMLEMAENLLKKGCPHGEVEKLFKEVIQHEYPYEGAKISIEHVKINGRVFHLGEGRILFFDEKNQKIRLLRIFSTPGVYDGLKVRKNPGDYAITTMRIGEWNFRTSYFSKDGEYKGTYVNINTPIEFYPTKVRYVDLEADICMWPNGKIKKIDFEKLEEMVHYGYISERLKRTVLEKIDEVLNTLNPEAEKEVQYITSLGNSG